MSLKLTQHDKNTSLNQGALSLLAKEEAELEVFLFKSLLCGGFENPNNVKASIKFNIEQHESLNFVAKFSQQLMIEPAKKFDGELSATITMPLDIIKRINNENTNVDFRDPSLLAFIKLEGDYQVVKYLVHACQRPTDDTKQRFKFAEILHKKHNYSSLTAIDRVHQATQYQVLESIESGKPMIITGLLNKEGESWTIKKMVECYADVLIKVRSNQQRLTLQDIANEFEHYQHQPYDENSGEFARPYTMGTNLPEEMKAAFGPMYFNTHDYIQPQLWLGMLNPKSPATQIHRDPLCGFLLQILGRKRMQLISADQASLLHPLKAYNNFQFCWFKSECASEINTKKKKKN